MFIRKKKHFVCELSDCNIFTETKIEGDKNANGLPGCDRIFCSTEILLEQGVQVPLRLQYPLSVQRVEVS